MKTDDLIGLLARDAHPTDTKAPARRFAVAMVIGLATTVALVTLLLGLRPDLAQAIRLPTFWLRLAFVTATAAGALGVTLRLAYPGVRIGGRWAGFFLPIALAWTGAALVLLHVAPDMRMPLLLGGRTWKVCSLLIASLSMPCFAALLWAMRGMAPVRPRAAGAMAGMVAGATAAMAYSLHCPELAPPFWSTWYVLGMLAPAALGAVFGPRLLRW